MVEIPYGEFRPDISDLNSSYISILNNVLPRGDGYGPIKSYVDFTTALPAACRGYFYARKTDGSVAIFAGTSTKLYKLNNTDFSWEDVARGGGSYTALSTTGQWQFAQFNNFVIAVQANDVPQVYDLTSSTDFANLAGSPPQAAYISIINRFVVLSGLLSQPYRVQWSGLNDTTNWTAGTNFSDFQDLPDGGVVRGVAGGEYGLIMQDQSIRRMIYAPGSDLVFQIDRVAQDRGLNAPYSLVPAGERMFFYSAQGFIMSDASGGLTPIGKERIDRIFKEDFNSASPQLFIGAADPVSNIVVWTYQSLAGQANVFDKVLIYDWAIQRWTRGSVVMGEYIASLSKPGLTLESLDAISGSLDALPFSLDDISTATLPGLSFASSLHRIGFLSGDNLEAIIETAEYSSDKNRTLVNGFTPACDAPSIFGSVGSRDKLAKNVTSAYTDESAMNEDGFCPVLGEGRYVRARLRIPAAQDWTYVRGVTPDLQKGSPL